MAGANRALLEVQTLSEAPVHSSGRDGRLLLPEMMGPGAALLDLDGDGDLDLVVLDGAPFAGSAADAPAPRDRVLRNDLDRGRGLAWTDITGRSGLRSDGYGVCTATGDIDGDGHTDLFVGTLGTDLVVRSRGDGRLTPLANPAVEGPAQWTNAATFLDYDRDGDLDLFVVHYVDFAPDRKADCYAADSAPDYCGPDAYDPLPDRLYRNTGDGRFEDVTGQAGLTPKQAGAGLGVVAADLNGDGWTDLYVANDGDPNHLWLNQGDGTFTESGLWNGVALNAQGRSEAGMGVDAGDADGDGDLDLFVTHLRAETNTLYVQTRGGQFEDRTARAGLAAPSVPYTGFGTRFFDADSDGDLDLYVANGLVRLPPERRKLEGAARLGQRDHLYLNDGSGRFSSVDPAAEPALQLEEPGRGVAFGDLDNDGDTDLVVSVNEAQPRLLVNRSDPGDRWLGVRAVTGSPARDALGAELRVLLADGRVVLRRVGADGGYASAHDPRILLAETGALESLEIRWPDGSRELFHPPSSGRYVTIRQGTGRAPGAPAPKQPAAVREQP